VLRLNNTLCRSQGTNGRRVDGVMQVGTVSGTRTAVACWCCCICKGETNWLL